MTDTPSNPSDITDPLRVVGICGSLRPSGSTFSALRVALEGAREAGAQAEMIDLARFDLPFCDGTKQQAERYPDIPRLRERVRTANGIILATPEYHGSVSGVLKNALDLMGFQEFEGKMVGLVSVSGGSMGGANALNDLRNVGRSLHAWVVPEQASVADAGRAFDTQGRPLDPKLEARLKAVGRQVAQFGRLHTPQHIAEFLRLWEAAPVNPGGDGQ